MSWEKVGASRSKQRAGRNTNITKNLHYQTESEIRRFLKTYKTKPCEKTDIYHDYRLCEYYHPNVDDQRRDPYRTYYSPDAGTCLNSIETMYHPIVFRTGFCQNGSNCIFGKKCARAHSCEQLRDRLETTDKYNEEFQPAPKKSSLASLIDLSSLSLDNSDFTSLAQESWKQRRVSPKKMSLKIPAHLWFAVHRSNELFYQIQEAVFEECLGTVNLEIVNELNIRGTDLCGIKARINSLLDEPSPFFSTRILTFGKRITSCLKEVDKKELSKSNDIFIEFMSGGKLQMTAVRRKGEAATTAKLRLENEIAKLDFWIKQSKYNAFYLCCCCYEDFNIDQGIICKNGHFYCSEGECFATLVKSQILELSSRKDDSLLCPLCSVPFQKRDVASNLSEDVFDQYQKAIVDAKVTKKADEMNVRFNERLQSAIAEVLNKYESAESMLLLEAKNLANQARNTVLNLSCPHCKSAYFDFSGCMAIQCGRCKGHFCAYCHQKFVTGRGAHEHVRQCLMNETDDGNYYANAEQIRDAQKRYRTREIKKFLRAHKKNLQNAIVIELKKDLEDLGIKQEALFELGNLM